MVGPSQRGSVLDTQTLVSIISAIASAATAVLAFWQANQTVGGFFAGLAIASLIVIIWLRMQNKAKEIDSSGTINPVEPGKVEVEVGTIDSTKERLLMELRLITRDSDGAPARDQLILSWGTLIEGADKLYEYFKKNKVEFSACIGINASGLVLANYIGASCRVRRSCIGAFLTSDKENGERKIDLALPAKADKSEMKIALSGKVLIVDSELKTGASFRLASKYLVDKCKFEVCNIRYAVLMICKIDSDRFDRAKEDSRSQPGSWLKDLSAYGSSPKWPIPNYIAYCTPGSVEMPKEIH